jgi:hypothetical protein
MVEESELFYNIKNGRAPKLLYINIHSPNTKSNLLMQVGTLRSDGSGYLAQLHSRFPVRTISLAALMYLLSLVSQYAFHNKTHNY